MFLMELASNNHLYNIVKTEDIFSDMKKKILRLRRSIYLNKHTRCNISNYNGHKSSAEISSSQRQAK